MILSQNSHLLAVLLAVNFASHADAHGYLKTPRSRNYYASMEGKWSGGTENDPAVETCPHCLNIGGTEARCGFVGDHNYDLPPNAIGGIMPAVTQGCYKPGADITFESVLTAHHMGHFAFKACAISHGEVPTQECFDANPLTFVSDELYGANADPLYPERAYIPRTDYEGGLVRDSGGDYVMRHTFRLPAGLSGDLVLIQWHYVTGNSCKDVGYDTYDWPDGFYPGNLPTCSQPLPEDGRGVPEQFWNCAELRISNECDGPEVISTSATTTSSTSASSTNTGATVTTSATSTTSSTTTTGIANVGTCKAETGACGPDQPCGDGLCCSQWGYCGATEAYCGACCQNGNCWNDPTSSTSRPTSQTTASPTNNPVITPDTSTSSTTTSTSTTTSSSSSVPDGEWVIDTSNRCGFTELDARENCKPVCLTDSDCAAGEFCWSPHENYCGSIPKRTYTDPVQSNVNSRCGTSELDARTFCGEPCSWQCSKPGESCFAVHTNYCGSEYNEEGVSKTTTSSTSSGSSTTIQTTTGTTTSGSTGATTSGTATATITTSFGTSSPTTLFPTASPITRPPTSSAAEAVESVLEASKDGIDNNILLYQTPSMQWEPSSVYRYNDLLAGLRVMYNNGVANKFFYMGDDSPNGHKYGLVNIAAFLAQSMKETIQYNACDENSWDLVNGVYPVSNACGQLGQSYQDYKCSAEEAHMECPVNPNMKIKATTNAKWYGAPAPLYCGPRTDYPFTGYWDHSAECNKPWANPPEYCEEYDGQKAGAFNNQSPVPNSSGRTDVEGCCFWGRGVIQTTGVCNFGKLNYYLGARAAEEGREAMYPDINFCEQPDAICASEEHKELKWIAGMFYWVESLQSYNVGGWNYIDELHKFVDNGMSGNSFIDAVSGIVNRGCHDPPCATGDVDGKADRSSNFYKVLAEFDI